MATAPGSCPCTSDQCRRAPICWQEATKLGPSDYASFLAKEAWLCADPGYDDVWLK